jgi:Sulfotransferase domain
MGVPNLFILGAGRCGTTTLWDILGQHPDIHVSSIKEPSFFCSYYQVVTNPVDYARLFDSDARYRVDASHVYLSNPESAQLLKDFFPAAKFIVILRDPKRRANSLYNRMRRPRPNSKILEPIKDFADALRAEDRRLKSRKFFRNCRQYFWNYMYCRSSFFDEQLARYFALFEREQFYVLSLAELSSDAATATKKLFTFLDVNTELSQNTFTPRNGSGESEPWSADSDKIMDETFGDLTERTERLVGRALDWSM